MKKTRDRFLSVLSLVCRLPIKGSFGFDLSRSDFFLPALGTLASAAALAGLGAGALVFREPWLAALLALALQYLAFNLFHLDGLLDSADALLPAVSRERRFEILKDPRIGTYAFFAGFLVLALKLAALTKLAAPGGLGSGAVAALLAAPVAGRTAAALVPLLAAPARPEGLGALMKGFSPWRVAGGFVIGLAPLGLWTAARAEALGAWAAVAAVLAVPLAGIPAARAYARKLGGFTGDALGAAVELGELATILGLAALASLLA